MPVPFINHVALPVDDVDRAAAFYADWFGARAIPAPNFGVPVAWLLLGKIQVHLVAHVSHADAAAPCTAHHFAVAIDDREAFERLYDRAEREGRFDTTTFPHHMFVLPGGDVQLWVRDPSGNVIEVDYPQVGDLDLRIAGAARRWVEDDELDDVHRQASLFRPEQAGIALDGRLAAPAGELASAEAVGA